MDEIIIKSDDLLVMNLINYFITEENYKPMIIHGINDEIWLENLDNNYKIVRIVSHHIHNKEQLDFDKFIKFVSDKSEVDDCKLSIPIGAVSFCGSGEPLLYDRIVEIVEETKNDIIIVNISIFL